MRLWPLFAGLALIGLAIGVQGSLLGIRAELEEFNDYLIRYPDQGRAEAFLEGFELGCQSGGSGVIPAVNI